MEKLATPIRATFKHIAEHRDMRPTNRELRWLAHINRHGPLSSAALLDQTKDTHRCRDTGLRSLQKLRAAGLISLPPQQRAIAHAEFRPYIYNITKAGQLWLEETNQFENAVRPSGHFWHSYSVSSLTSAFDRETSINAIRFIPAHTILDIRKVTLGIPYSGGTAIPDQIFALDYGGSFRAFLLEVDRGTEPITSKTARESLAQKVAAYAAIVKQDLHRQHYGLKSPVALLFTFMSSVRAQSFIKLLAPHPELASVTLVQVLPPDDPIHIRIADAVQKPWLRAIGGQMEILKRSSH